MATPRCPYCHDRVEPGAAGVLDCQACGAPHHLGCVGESVTRRCATCEGALKAPLERRRTGDWREAAALERQDPYQHRSFDELVRPRDASLRSRVITCLILCGAPMVLGGLLGLAAWRERPVATRYVGPYGVQDEAHDAGSRWGGLLPGIAAGALVGAIFATSSLRSERPLRRRRRPVSAPQRDAGRRTSARPRAAPSKEKT